MTRKKSGLPKEPKLPKLTREQHAAVQAVIKAREASAMTYVREQDQPLFEAHEKEATRLRGELIRLQGELRQRAADHQFEVQGLEQRLNAANFSMVLLTDQVQRCQTEIRWGTGYRSSLASVDTQGTDPSWEGAATRDSLALAG